MSAPEPAPTRPSPFRGRSLWPALAGLALAGASLADLPYDPAFVGATLVQHLVNGEYHDVHQAFAGHMKNALPPEQIRRVWERVQREAGGLRFCGESRAIREAESYMSVYVPCQFERVALDVKLSLDGQGYVNGMVFVPSERPPSSTIIKPPTPTPAPDASLPAHLKGTAFDEVPVTVGAAPWALEGTLTLPKGAGPFPALVLVHGSGPLDRDSTVGGVKPFRDLAFGLARKGIATLRYEKRSKAHGGRMAGLRRYTVREETLEDAAAAVTLLRGSARVDKSQIYVAGHGLGGMLVPRIGMADPALAGLVVLAGNARPLHTVFLEQVEYVNGLPPELSGVAPGGGRNTEAVRAQAARIDFLTNDEAAKREILLGVPPSYWLDLKSYRAAEEARKLTQRVLVLHCGRDYQVTEKDRALWEEGLSGKPGSIVKTLPSLNHLMVAGVGPSVPKEYDAPGWVAGEVIDEIASFVLKAPQPRASKPKP